MARTIRLDQIGDYAAGKVDQLLRSAVLQTDTLVKQESPVDTGRFRASWQVGENAVSQYDAGPVQAPVNTERTLTKPPNRPEVPIRKMNYQQETLGNVYSVHNNLPYAEPLANGSSKQAPAGWIQVIAKDMQTYVRTEADRIGRQL
jgi:hypothetical protein